MQHLNFMRRLSLMLTLSSVLIIPSVSNAQDKSTTPENTFSLSGQLRPRLEFRDGSFQPLAKGQKPATLISDRIRFTMDYSYKSLLTVRISPQTVGIWGQEPMVQSPENSGNKIALFEAWTNLKLSPTWDMKLGRQVISLDDERIFGELDWAQGARAHDALSFHFHKNNYEVKSFFGFNQNYKMNYGNNINNPTGNTYNTTDAYPYKWMQTLWAGIPVSKSSKLTLLFTNLGFQNALSSAVNPKTFYSQTYGANLVHSKDNLGITLSVYYQGGRDQANKKIDAYLFSASANYKASGKWNIGLGSDLLSGFDYLQASSTDKVFTPYFHTLHKFYGFMDYFSNGNSIGGVGLSDTYLKLNYLPNEKLSLGLALHQFFTPNTVVVFTQKYKSNIGQEADATFALKINKIVQLSGGYSCYLTTPTLNLLKNTMGARKYQQWAWMSLNVTPTFFQYNKSN